MPQSSSRTAACRTFLSTTPAPSRAHLRPTSPMRSWDRVVEVNLSAQFVLTRTVGAAMLQRGSGKVIFTASLLSFQGGINVIAYTAAKSGLAGVTRALANEWAGQGVNVNAIVPGYIATDNTQALQDDPDREAAIRQRIPAGRWGRARRLGRCGGVSRLQRIGLRARCVAARRRRLVGAMSGSRTGAHRAAAHRAGRRDPRPESRDAIGQRPGSWRPAACRGHVPHAGGRGRVGRTGAQRANSLSVPAR